MSLLTIAPEFFAEYVCKPGCVILFQHPHFPKKPHYFVLLNANPLDHQELIFVMVTSNVARIERLILCKAVKPGTVIMVDGLSCSLLVKKSYIDCNSIYSFTPEQIRVMVEKHDILQYGRMETTVFGQIRSAVIESNQVVLRHKKLI